MKLQIKIPPKEIYDAQVLVEKVKEKNNFPFKLTLTLDYNDDDAGYYAYENELVINPEKCTKRGSSKYECYGYVYDSSVTGVILHEFIHFLTLKYFKDFMERYEEEFPIPLFLNSYVKNFKHDRREEVAEIGILYITNPYLLKLISAKRFQFFKRYFKTPNSAGKKYFFKIYNGFPIEIQKRLQKVWKLEIKGKTIICGKSVD